MNIYHFDNNGDCKIVLQDKADISYPERVASSLIIPLENAVLLNGLVYDNRELDYWKAAKRIELENYLNNADNAGFETSLKIKMDCNETSISKLNLGLSNYNLIATKDADKVNLCDYNNELHSITFLQFKQICKEVGADYSDRYGKKWIVRKSINEAKTISEVQAIIV
jgi:hypothetical protein